jgi:hypothetical protein
MKTPTALPSFPTSGSPLISFCLFVVSIFVAYEVAQAILADDVSLLSIVALVFAGGCVLVAILNDWRRGLYFLVAWMLFEDFARKFLGNNMAIYFAKDILALALYLSFFRARLAKKIVRFRIPFQVSFMLFFWFCVLQMFNPASNSVFNGILGLKVNFLYVPLIFVGYSFIESEDDLRRFFSFVCVLILIVASLGLAQSIIGPSFLNPKVLQEDIRELSSAYRLAPISGLVAYRPTSVFVSAGRFQDFLIVSWLITLGFGGYLLLRTRRARTLAFGAVGVVAAASLMSASRGVFMWNAGTTLLIVAGFLWGAPWREREAIRVLRAIQRTSLLIGCGVVILLTIFPKELGSRLAIYSETLLPDSPASELVNRTQSYPIKQLEFAFDHPRWPYGYGLGTCTLGLQYVRRVFHTAVMNVGVESGFGNLVVELGIFGLILWIVMGISIVASTWSTVIELRGTPWFPLAFAIFLYAVLLLFPMMFAGAASYQDYVLNADFWLFLGVLYRLRQFPKTIQATPRQPSSAKPIDHLAPSYFPS